VNKDYEMSSELQLDGRHLNRWTLTRKR